MPEGIGLYNLIGRSATDGGDQERKRLSLANRRQLRSGPKGALLDAEIAMVNATVVAEDLRSHAVPVWTFVFDYSTEVLSSVILRRRVPAWLRAFPVSNESEADAEPAAVTRAQQQLHQPVDLAAEWRRKRKAGELVDSDPKRQPKPGRCASSECRAGLPQRGDVWCAGCAREVPGCNGWYHLECFCKRHKVQLR